MEDYERGSNMLGVLGLAALTIIGVSTCGIISAAIIAIIRALP